MQDGDDWLSPLFQKVAEELGYHGAFHLAAGEHVSSVYQTGFLHPYILLPTQIDMFRMRTSAICFGMSYVTF